MKLTRLYHGRLALVDLAAGTAGSVPLSPDFLEEGIGGGALAAVLARQYPGAMFFCAGPLVGGYAPASGLMTVSFPHSGGGGLTHAINPLGHGAWLRQSGFDALVLTGRGKIPRVIRCAKGICTIEDAPGAGCRSRAKLRASLLRRTADGRAALVLADCSNAALPVAAGAEYGSFPAGTLTGPAMKDRNILAVCLEGGSPLPPMPTPLDNPLRRACTAPPGQSALAAFFQEAKRDFEPGLDFNLKSAACFHCPSPCLAWIKTGEGAHLLLADHGAFAAAVDACGKDAPACLAACDEAGVDPRIAGSLLKDETIDAYHAFLGAAAWNKDNSFPRPPGEQFTEAERAGLVLGMCPRLVRRVPGLTREAFDALLGDKAAAMLARSENLLGQEVFL